MASDYVVTVDGGGGERNQAGPCYCSVRVDYPGNYSKISRYDLPGCKTNNEAEYASVIAGLDNIKEYLVRAGIRIELQTVLIRSDSQLVIHQCRGQWRVKAENLKPFHARVMELVREFREVKFEWVTGTEMKRILGH